MAAPAYPVGCTPGDNLAVHVAVTTAPRGSVLVVDVGQVADRGYWGEVLTTAAEAAGLAGLVLDGGVRDVAALEAHGFPVFSATIALTGATKDKPGTVGVPVRVGGVRGGGGGLGRGGRRRRGLRAAWAPWSDVLAAGRDREAKEAGFFEALRSGSTTVELLGLDASLVRQGDTGYASPRWHNAAMSEEAVGSRTRRWSAWRWRGRFRPSRDGSSLC